MLTPFDDLPVHQTTRPVAIVSTSDRNFYDRYYFNAFCVDRPGLAITAGMGFYPNLGVADGFVAATLDDRQYVVRASRELSPASYGTTVGPLRIEVLEGLRRLRLVLEPTDGDVELDLTWERTMPAFLEADHVNRRGPRITTETSRFAQTGRWSGTLSIASEEFDVGGSAWRGGRDRSWGIRPVGEPEPTTRRFTDSAGGGFLWLYCTMQFEEFSIVCILQEDRVGARSLEQAVRVWRDESRAVDDLGSIQHDLEFEDGTRRLRSLRLHLAGSDTQAPMTVDATRLASSYLSLGTGYGTEPDWRHGAYQGPLEVQHRSYDLGDPSVAAAAYGLVDDIAEYRIGDLVGYGLLENAVLGANDRYGFGQRR